MVVNGKHNRNLKYNPHSTINFVMLVPQVITNALDDLNVTFASCHTSCIKITLVSMLSVSLPLILLPSVQILLQHLKINKYIKGNKTKELKIPGSHHCYLILQVRKKYTISIQFKVVTNFIQ